MPKSRVLSGGVMLAAVAALAVTVMGAKHQYRTLKTADHFDKLLAELTAEAESYAASSGDGPPTTSKAVSGIEYATEAAQHLAKAIQKPHTQQLVRLHVAYQLIQPLDNAGAAQLRSLQPALLGLFEICRYKPMPSWPEHKLQVLAQTDENLSKEARKRREAARREFLAEKKAAERAVVKFNRLAGALQQHLKVLLVRMGSEQADELLLARLSKEELSRWNTFDNTLEVIGSEAVRMAQPQAKRHYDALRQHMGRSRRKRAYLDPTRPVYSHTGNSSFARREIWFAQAAAKVVNLLATTAKEPAIIVPGEKRPRDRRPVRPRHRRR